MDHCSLISKMGSCVGIKEIALKWFKSFFSVRLGTQFSGSVGFIRGPFITQLFFEVYASAGLFKKKNHFTFMQIPGGC